MTTAEQIVADLELIAASMPPPVVMRVECPARVVNQGLTKFERSNPWPGIGRGIEVVRNDNYGRMWRLTYTDGSVSMFDPVDCLKWRAEDWQ